LIRVSARRLDPLLRPRSVVVVGASTNPSFVSLIYKNLLRAGFAGNVAAVNPRYTTIGGAPCFASVADVPWPIDLAVVGVSWRQFPTLLEQCEQKHVGALVILTSGFAESGGEGALRQTSLAQWAQRTATPVGGPNCLGLMHVPSGLHALPSTFPRLVAGEVGLILQSGMMAPSVLTPLFARNIGVTFAVTTGNEVDVDMSEYIRYLVDDDQTRVIGCFAEQIKRPAAFVDACEIAVKARKPIVMLKIGRSEAAQRSALAHTGSLVGADSVIDAVFDKLGVTRVSSVDALFEALAVFHTRRLPRGDGLAAISVSGGAAGLLSDLAIDCGVRFAPLAADTQAGLREVVPEFGSVGNPLDITGQGVFQTDLLERSLDLLANDPEVDALLYARSIASRMDADSAAYHALEQSVARHPETPLITMSLSGGHFMDAQSIDQPPAQPVDRLDGVPFLQGSEYGLRAIGALMRYARYQRQRMAASDRRLSPETVAAKAREVVQRATGTRLSVADGAAVLDLYGIPRASQSLVTTLSDALAVAPAVGYPLVVKVEAPSLAHKAAAGGVVLDVQTPEALQRAFTRVTASARDAEGVLIQHQLTDGIAEVLVGMSHDPQFGPVVACGLGGVNVEAMRDVRLLLPPVSEADGRAALERLRGASRLARADVPALIDVLRRFAELCVDLGDLLGAIDLNPLIVRPADRGIVAVDYLFEVLAAH
jgi:acetyltransferase